MKLFTNLFLGLLFCLSLTAQNTFVYFHNNTNLSFTATTTGTPDASDWDGFNGTITPLEPNLQMMRLYRDWISSSSSAGMYDVTTRLTFPTGEWVDLQIEYEVEAYSLFSNPVPTINFRHSTDGSNYANQPWRDNNSIYEENTFTVAGVDYILRYQSYSTAPSGIYNDILYSIYPAADEPPYQVMPSDLTDPDILNIMSLNAFMRPTLLFQDDQATRADHIADYVPDMDVIILQEAFDNTTRATLLANLATEYPYQSSVVDDTSNALEDGGVVIVSRWPFDNEDQLLWGSTCFEDDCVSNKGIKYVRVNKLGRIFHVFGTHMDAFNKVEDVDTRKDQLIMWKSWISSKSIPTTEAVFTGGDFNVDKFLNKQGEYDTLFGNFAAIEPIYAGHSSTWDTDLNLYNQGEPYPPEFLDYVFANDDHLVPSTNLNTNYIFRSNRLDMWRIFDLSDHNPVWGRFTFPPLPVELMAFNGVYDDIEKVNRLFWQTSSELNNEKFIIEKSDDGENFFEIGEVRGQGNSSELTRYTFDDKDVVNGINYYRLKQIDFDGTKELSDVIAVNAYRKSISIASLYPNPSTRGSAELNIKLNALEDANIEIRIEDFMGRQWLATQEYVFEGESQISIQTNDLASGVYIIRIIGNNADTEIVKWIKN